VLGLGLVVVRLGDSDGAADIEGSLGKGALLGLSLTVRLGLRDLSLVGNGVLVGDDDVLGTDLGLGASGLGGELGVSTSSLGTGEGGRDTGRSTSRAGSTAVAGISVAVSTRGARIADLGLAAAVGVHALEGSSGGNTEESNDGEFHV